MCAIRFAKGVEQDLDGLTTFRRKVILDAVEAQLHAEPTTPTRNRKLLVNLVPPWTAEPPIWELRVGDYRVFYDVSQADTTVYVRAIRLKPPGKATGESR